MKETKIYMELPSSCDECPIEHCGEYCTLNGVEIDTWSYSDKRPKDCPLIDIKDHNRELVAKVLGMVRENLKEELLLTKNENQEEAKLKLVKTYSIDLDVLNKIEKEILNGYTKI